MMDIVGYCSIKKDAKTGVGSEPQTFLGKDVRVMEFDDWGGVLALNSEANAMCMFDKCDVIRAFKCSVSPDGHFVLPPNLHPLEQMVYIDKLMHRKGGYNETIKHMVIQYGLMKGVYNDDFLFQIEREENAAKYHAASEKINAITDIFKNI